MIVIVRIEETIVSIKHKCLTGREFLTIAGFKSGKHHSLRGGQKADLAFLQFVVGSIVKNMQSLYCKNRKAITLPLRVSPSAKSTPPLLFKL